MNFEQIVDNQQLIDFCKRQSNCEYVAFDTEFVSENRYRPQLCLVQVATPRSLAIIDTLTITDMRPFWDLICNQVPLTITHAAREEFLFCYREMKSRPAKLIDLQVIAAFVGMEFPAAYSSLANQLLGERLSKGETRTDWRQRPLSKKQIQYALQDVEFLFPMFEVLNQRLVELGRQTWYDEEIDIWQRRMEEIESEPQWQRLPGLTKLNRRELSIVRELYLWRETAAQNRERSPRRILPDDLLIEIAKRGEFQTTKLTAIRGLTQRVSARCIPEIAEVVERTLQLPESKLPEKITSSTSPSIGILGQFLTTSLNLVCHEQKIAPGLVATTQDIRNLAAWKMGLPVDETLPSLLQGWRKDFLSGLFDDVINGRVVLRVQNPKSANPVRLVRWDDAKG